MHTGGRGGDITGVRTRIWFGFLQRLGTLHEIQSQLWLSTVSLSNQDQGRRDLPPVKKVRTCSGSLYCSGFSLSIVLINCLKTRGIGLISLPAEGGGERFRGFYERQHRPTRSIARRDIPAQSCIYDNTSYPPLEARLSVMAVRGT